MTPFKEKYQMFLVGNLLAFRDGDLNIGDFHIYEGRPHWPSGNDRDATHTMLLAVPVDFGDGKIGVGWKSIALTTDPYNTEEHIHKWCGNKRKPTLNAAVKSGWAFTGHAWEGFITDGVMTTGPTGE